MNNNEFKIFKKAIQDNFKAISKDVDHLFEVAVDKDELWNLYLDSYPAGTNEIFRERREHDCCCCRHFIKDMGNAVVLKDNKITTIWDVEINSTIYQPVADALANYIKSKVITDVYVSKFNKKGTDKNFEELVDGKTIEWQHFYLELPDKFVDKSSRSEGDIKGSYRDTRNVFKRSLDEISEEALLTVLELISSNTLYKGEEWKPVLNEFLKHKKAYEKLKTNEERELYAWEQSVKVGGSIGRIRNHSIGTLLINISENMDLDAAVRAYERIVAPENYKRPKAIYTKKMLDDARKTIEDLGLLDSISNRRFAVLDDISVNNVLFSNKDAARRMQGADILAEMAENMPIDTKKFSKVEEISIENFIKDILPSSKDIEVLLENRHSNNLVSLIAPGDIGSKLMFKWGNNFSYAYTGNIADSSMKENVKNAGGKVDGDLRFSIQWNDISRDSCDLDAHCMEPSKYEIHFRNRHDFSPSKGKLDVDIVNPRPGIPAVENITYANRKTMQNGNYDFFVHYFSGRPSEGFRAEIEFDGQLYSFESKESHPSSGIVKVATVTLKDGKFTIKEHLQSSVSSKEIWNLKTNQFVPVSVIMYSPNYWDEQNGIGHRHYMFMLKDCINSEEPSGFYNEFLQEELMKHKNVFEALGSKVRVKDSEDQLSGLGFSSTKRNDLVVKVKGQIERIFKIKF